MIEAALVLLVLAVLALHAWTTRGLCAALDVRSANQHSAAEDHARALTTALAAERARVSELLRLLEARAAPAEFAAYANPDVVPPAPETWVFSDDGLVGRKVEDE